MKRTGWVILVLALLVPSACSKKGRFSSPGASVVATVGERAIEFDEFADYVKKAAREDARSVSPQVASSLLDQYAEEVLLELAAEQAEPKVEGKTSAEKRRDLMNRRAKLSDISDSELKEEYEKHLDVYQKPEMVRLSQLILPDKEKAEQARKKLEKGADWVEVSKELSEAPNKGAGGSLGFLARKDLPDDFEKAVWKQKVGTATLPVAAGSGFHIFRVEERLEGRTVTFEEAKAALRLAVAEQKASRTLEALLKESQEKNPVWVLEDHLPFPYVGKLPKKATN